MRNIIAALVIMTCPLVLSDCRKSHDAEITPLKMCVVKSTAGLNVRSSPSVSGAKLATIPDGTRVPVFKYSNKKVKVGAVEDYWAYVEFNTKRGWVFNGFLADAGASDAAGPGPEIEVKSPAMKSYIEGLARKRDLQIQLSEFAFFAHHKANEGVFTYGCHVVCGEGCENPPLYDLSRMIFEADKITLYVTENKTKKMKCSIGKEVFTDSTKSGTCTGE